MSTDGRGRTGAQTRRIILLGSTGSIGSQTLDVVEHLNALADRDQSPVRYQVVGLAAGRNAAALEQQSRRFPHARLAMAGAPASPVHGASTPSIIHGPDAAERLVREVECDIVLNAMVGSAGLPATLAAIDLRRDIAIANKETLVAAGALVVPRARAKGVALLPVDSEHAGVWQCLTGPSAGAPPVDLGREVARVILTASGGPFRTRSRDEVYHAAPEDALKHPTWQMGAKITVDCASLTNKALEVVEAHWLFGLPPEKLSVLVHPQSIVHAIVEYADGSAVAQLGASDMRGPILHALTHPHRLPAAGRTLDWAALRALEFAPPDLERFPALGLAWDVMEQGGTSGAVMNAANEAAVAAFLDRRIPFGRIPEITRAAMVEVGVSPVRGLDDVVLADAEGRRYVEKSLNAAMARA